MTYHAAFDGVNYSCIVTPESVIYDVQKKMNHNFNCILRVVLDCERKGMLLLLFIVRLDSRRSTAGTSKCVGLMHIFDATQQLKKNPFSSFLLSYTKEFIFLLMKLNAGMHSKLVNAFRG